MYEINITVVNSLGTFKGSLELDEGETYERVSSIVEGLQKNINNIDRMTIVGNDGTEITFTEGALKGAVISFYVREL